MKCLLVSCVGAGPPQMNSVLQRAVGFVQALYYIHGLALQVRSVVGRSPSHLLIVIVMEPR